MLLLGLTLEISSALTADRWVLRRGNLGRRISGMAMGTSGLIVAGALSYGLAAEAWRLVGVLGAAVQERV